MIRLRHIEAFYAIRKAGSVNAAAKILNISQPALSRTIQHAESLIGFALFTRAGKRLVPTVEAEIIFVEAEKIYRGVEELRRLVKNLKGGAVTNLRVGLLPSLGVGLAPQAITAFRAVNPLVTFEIRTLNHDDMLAKLRSLEIDVGVAFDIRKQPGIASTSIGEADLVYVDRPGALAGTGPVPLTGIDADRLIGLDLDSPVGTLLVEAFGNSGLDYSPAIQVYTYAVAAAFATEGAGCAILDEFTARSWGHRLDIRPLDPRLTFSVVALTPELAPPTQTVRNFVDTLRRTLQARPALV
ncbi:LysR family transcriptional regulator [Azospirillum thermophilum]|uniref:LysR family transcriptional regulator n=1 Tax=Azospirillum thermophilum TaxID=2202148 RepID=UPI00143D0FFE|nr:LysR family transcriptional regulator [Azospirillum thermophilum]